MVDVEVEYSYEAEQTDELTIKVGDILHNVIMSEGGWWEGELNGKKGMFPDNFVKVVSKEPKKEEKKDVQASKRQSVKDLANKLKDRVHDGPAPARKKPVSVKKRGKVIFAYEPENEDELKLTVGDHVDILKQLEFHRYLLIVEAKFETNDMEEEGWWEGIVHGKQGMFPSNFIEITDDSEAAETTEKPEPVESEASSLIKGKKVHGVGLGNIFGDGPIKLRSTTGKKPVDRPQEPPKIEKRVIEDPVQKRAKDACATNPEHADHHQVFPNSPTWKPGQSSPDSGQVTQVFPNSHTHGEHHQVFPNSHTHGEHQQVFPNTPTWKPGQSLPDSGQVIQVASYCRIPFTSDAPSFWYKKDLAETPERDVSVNVSKARSPKRLYSELPDYENEFVGHKSGIEQENSVSMSTGSPGITGSEGITGSQVGITGSEGITSSQHLSGVKSMSAFPDRSPAKKRRKKIVSESCMKRPLFFKGLKSMESNDIALMTDTENGNKRRGKVCQPNADNSEKIKNKWGVLSMYKKKWHQKHKTEQKTSPKKSDDLEKVVIASKSNLKESSVLEAGEEASSVLEAGEETRVPEGRDIYTYSQPMCSESRKKSKGSSFRKFFKKRTRHKLQQYSTSPCGINRENQTDDEMRTCQVKEETACADSGNVLEQRDNLTAIKEKRFKPKWLLNITHLLKWRSEGRSTDVAEGVTGKDNQFLSSSETRNQPSVSEDCEQPCSSQTSVASGSDDVFHPQRADDTKQNKHSFRVPWSKRIFGIRNRKGYHCSDDKQINTGRKQSPCRKIIAAAGDTERSSISTKVRGTKELGVVLREPVDMSTKLAIDCSEKRKRRISIPATCDHQMQNNPVELLSYHRYAAERHPGVHSNMTTHSNMATQHDDVISQVEAGSERSQLFNAYLKKVEFEGRVRDASDNFPLPNSCRKQRGQALMISPTKPREEVRSIKTPDVNENVHQKTDIKIDSPKYLSDVNFYVGSSESSTKEEDESLIEKGTPSGELSNTSKTNMNESSETEFLAGKTCEVSDGACAVSGITGEAKLSSMCPETCNQKNLNIIEVDMFGSNTNSISTESSVEGEESFSLNTPDMDAIIAGFNGLDISQRYTTEQCIDEEMKDFLRKSLESLDNILDDSFTLELSETPILLTPKHELESIPEQEHSDDLEPEQKHSDDLEPEQKHSDDLEPEQEHSDDLEPEQEHSDDLEPEQEHSDDFKEHSNADESDAITEGAMHLLDASCVTDSPSISQNETIELMNDSVLQVIGRKCAIHEKNQKVGDEQNWLMKVAEMRNDLDLKLDVSRDLESTRLSFYDESFEAEDSDSCSGIETSKSREYAQMLLNASDRMPHTCVDGGHGDSSEQVDTVNRDVDEESDWVKLNWPETSPEIRGTPGMEGINSEANKYGQHLKFWQESCRKEKELSENEGVRKSLDAVNTEIDGNCNNVLIIEMGNSTTDPVSVIFTMEKDCREKLMLKPVEMIDSSNANMNSTDPSRLESNFLDKRIQTQLQSKTDSTVLLKSKKGQTQETTQDYNQKSTPSSLQVQSSSGLERQPLFVCFSPMVCHLKGNSKLEPSDRESFSSEYNKVRNDDSCMEYYQTESSLDSRDLSVLNDDHHDTDGCCFGMMSKTKVALDATETHENEVRCDDGKVSNNQFEDGQCLENRAESVYLPLHDYQSGCLEAHNLLRPSTEYKLTEFMCIRADPATGDVDVDAMDKALSNAKVEEKGESVRQDNVNIDTSNLLRPSTEYKPTEIICIRADPATGDVDVDAMNKALSINAEVEENSASVRQDNVNKQIVTRNKQGVDDTSTDYDYVEVREGSTEHIY